MDQYITITSASADPCDFISNFSSSIDVNEGYEVAITRIFHGPVFNIDEYHTKFALTRGDDIVNFEIPPAFYETTTHVLLAIYNTLVRTMHDPSKLFFIKTVPEIRYKQYGESSYLKILDKDVNFLVDTKQDVNEMVMQVFGYCLDGKFNRIDINHSVLTTTTEVGFLYSNIVTSSVIDDQRSRLLCCVPLKSAVGYSSHEFKNPAYLPLRVDSFTDISFQLRNVHGDKIRIENSKPASAAPVLRVRKYGSTAVEYPTVIALHIRKRLYIG